MNATIRGDRLHIAVVGRMNAGKSALVNALCEKSVSIVSDIPGTTTDLVYKSMELFPLGPVVFIDTAGLDDEQDGLGFLRTEQTMQAIAKADIIIFVIDVLCENLEFEKKFLELKNFVTIIQKTPVIFAFTKCDAKMSEKVSHFVSDYALKFSYVFCSSQSKQGIAELKQKIIECAPKDWEPPFLANLVHSGNLVLLVTPIDLSAPKGRLIMPQVKALREILDAHAIPIMCKEQDLYKTLASLNRSPDLVITDSQVFKEVSEKIDKTIPLTSFSILSAQQKGDLSHLVEGLKVLSQLKDGDAILIAEACGHHPLEDDIGRVKIPKWLRDYTQKNIRIDFAPFADFPKNLSEYKLVVHCGACTLNRKEMLLRISLSEDMGVPITNYGVLISFLKGVFPRALLPFKLTGDFFQN